MDYSTISNKTACTEAEEFNNGELSEKYYLLKKQYDNLSSTFEATKQELHDTRRSYQTALDIQSHLTTELESLQADEEKRKNEVLSRITILQEEISQLREERTVTADNHATEIKKYEMQIHNLKEVKETKIPTEGTESKSAELEELRSSLITALNDIEVVKTALEEARIETNSWRMKSEEMLLEMREMQTATEVKRKELKDANEREAVALADLAEAKAMLHQFQSVESQDLQPHAAKGNSIFAEVEDKRQEMAKNLIQMKQTNTRLRRELANKQAELDALLHEKQNVWEQQVGATAHHDRELIDGYEARITQLEGHCERQRRELARWFSKQCDPTAQGWLSGLLDHFKVECEHLRAEVLSQGAAQLASAAQIRDLRRKLAQMTANGGKLSGNTPPVTEAKIISDKVENEKPKQQAVVIKSKTVDDVKKKVSFN